MYLSQIMNNITESTKHNAKLLCQKYNVPVGWVVFQNNNISWFCLQRRNWKILGVLGKNVGIVHSLFMLESNENLNAYNILCDSLCLAIGNQATYQWL